MTLNCYEVTIIFIMLWHSILIFLTLNEQKIVLTVCIVEINVQYCSGFAQAE
jgi:hypothetical protein